ncbi:MAG: TonB-dependent receptor [Sphingomonadaceae bacterium]|nr:TonB-dependent receptor [Sphingomonadaceae bacterium]
MSAPALAADEVANNGEIVVTAQKREEKLQEVPLAITAVTGEALQNQASSDLKGISQIAPSLNVAVYPNSSDTLSLTMRGQGVADAGQITKDGGVGLYMDGFYISRPQAALLDLGDPERIEVLRGPQGTLYGRNTTGGAVNIISKKPTGELGADMSLTFGSRAYVRALANLNLPEFANISVKGTIVYTDQDGWVKNPGAVNNYGKRGQLAGRVAVRWTPAPSFTMDYAYDRGRVTSTQPYYVNPDLAFSVPGYNPDIDRTYAPLDIGLSKAHFQDHQLTLQWDASDWLTIRSLSSYRKTDAYQAVNYGVAQSPPVPGLDLTVEQQHQYNAKQYTQELQLVGTLGDMIDFTGGLYYFKETASHDQGQQLAAPLLLKPFTFVSTTREVDARSISKAAYLQLTVRMMEDRLKLTLGGRYTDDKRSAVRSSYFFGFPFETAVSNRQAFDNFSPSVNLSMQWTPDIMTYARYSRGYKAGGSGEGAPIFATATFRPEKVEAFEVGLKSQFWDRRATLNVSAFYNKFKDLQLDFTVDPVDLTLVATSNAGRATIKGAEVEFMLRPVDAVGLKLSYAYLDPQLKSILAPAGTNFDPAVNPGSPVNVGDDVTSFFTLPFVPKHSITITGDWRIIDTGDSSLTAYATYSYQDEIYTSSVAGPGVPGNAFWLSDPREVVNARIVWDQPLGIADVSVAGFVNNLFDHRSREFVIGIGSQLGGYFSQTSPWSEPRVFGVELKAGF